MSKAGFETRRAAQEDLTKALAAIADHRFVRPDRITTGAYLEQEWLPAVKPTVAASTYANYSVHIKTHLIPRIGDVPLQKLTEAHIMAVYGDLSRSGHFRSQLGAQKGLSAKSVRHIHTTLHRALNDAVEWGYISRNVASSKRTKPPKLTGAVCMTVWNAGQLHGVLGELREDRLFPLWRFFAMTGVRRGEAMGLRWSDVDLQAGSVSIIEARSVYGTSTPKTPRSRRSLDLDPETVAILKKWRRDQLEERMRWGELWTDTGLVFGAEDGKPYHPDTITGLFQRHQRNINKKIQAEAKARGTQPATLPQIRLHDLRHTHATLLLASGVNPKIVSERLGHASVAFTLTTYIHVLPGLQREAVCRLASLVDGPAAVNRHQQAMEV